MEEGSSLLGTGPGCEYVLKVPTPAGAPKALLEGLLVWSHLHKKWCGMPEGESRKDFWIWEKVTCEGLGLRSLENRDGGRKEDVPQTIREKAIFAEGVRRNRSAESRRFRSYTVGSFLALKPGA